MILKTLENVRSHRSFTDRPLTKTELSKIVEGARLGASAKNSQSIRFFCVSDKKLCDEIFEQIKWAAAVSWNPVLEESPRAYVILCASNPLTQTSEPLLHFDMGIASQNMLLCAAEMGFGGCIIGAYNKKEVEKLIALPEKYKSYFILALGEPKDKVKIVAAENKDTKYYRDTLNNHFVPKLSLNEIIIGNK